VLFRNHMISEASYVSLLCNDDTDQIHDDAARQSRYASRLVADQGQHE
jgi:hypothetical protein